jgi:hypothetical protein
MLPRRSRSLSLPPWRARPCARSLSLPPLCALLTVSHSLCLTLLITVFACVPHLSLSRSLALSLAPSLPRSLILSRARSLARSLSRALSLTRSLILRTHSSFMR